MNQRHEGGDIPQHGNSFPIVNAIRRRKAVTMSVIVKQKEKMQTIKQMKQEMIEKQAEVDGFPVEFVVRDENGRICAESTMVRVTETPAPLFGYNVRDFDFGYATEKAKSAESFEDHDFGACCIMRDSITKIGNEWYAKVSVPKGHQRHVSITKYLVKTDTDGNALYDESGTAILLRDDDGNYETTRQVQKEGFLLVKLSALETDLAHPMSAPYVQVDTDLKKQIGAAVASKKALAQTEKKASGTKRSGKRVRLSNAQLAAALAAEGV